MSTNVRAPLTVGSPMITAVYLLWLLGALAAGIFPEMIYRAHAGRCVVLPSLSVLSMGVVSFLLLAWPIRLMAVQDRSSWQVTVAQAGVDVLMGAAALVPFMVIAVFLADGSWRDGLRCVLASGACVPLGVLMGIVMGACKPLLPWVLLLGLLATLGMPAGVYVLREFFAASPGTAAKLWLAVPVGYAFDQGKTGVGGVLPEPYWPVMVWMIITAVVGIVLIAANRDASHSGPAKR